MKDLRPAILLAIIFTIVCGVIYPAMVTGVAQAIFPHQANGSLITDKSGKALGSTLIGQPFSDPKYFWPRPSSTADFGYNPLASGGSNSGPTNSHYLKTVGDRVKVLRERSVTGPIPSELVQASASGLDPHVSPEGVLVQVPRVAKARGLSENAVTRIITQVTEDRQLGFLGVARVNVLVLNHAMDKLKP